MEELCDGICQLFESRPINLKLLSEELNDLSKLLVAATSRFVDIDPSVKDDAALFQKVEKQLDTLGDEILKENLLQIYLTLKTYLGLKFKYGEAADWFLKNEFDTGMEENISETLKRVSLMN